MIPTFVQKLAILLHLPELTSLLINPYYQREELKNLEVNKQFEADNKISRLIKKAEREFKLGEIYLFSQTLEEIEK